VAELSNSERAELAALQETLPPVTDSKAPTPRVTGPRDPSSLRTATLTFSAAEPSVTFSCALDDNDFRLCTSAQSFDHLRPGRHIFKVRATDSVGNTGTASHSWTVDGSRIAFVSQRSGNHQIWVIDPEADSVAKQLTQAGSNNAPDWSPDRTKLAFHSNRDGNLEIYVMNADGSGQRRVTNNGSTDRNPTWSPDGTRIAFQRGPGDGPYDIYSMNADGTGEARQLTTHPEDDIDPAWSPTAIAFASRRDASTYEIYVMNPDGTGQRRLTGNTAQDFGPAWSPNGGKLAFHTDRVRDDDVRGPSHIYLMNPDSTGQSPLTTTGADDFNPAWAPDGQVLVFHRHYPVGGDEIWIINADGSGEIRLTNGEDDTVPDW
jgi:Tol biopolymer transport system component